MDLRRRARPRDHPLPSHALPPDALTAVLKSSESERNHSRFANSPVTSEEGNFFNNARCSDNLVGRVGGEVKLGTCLGNFRRDRKNGQASEEGAEQITFYVKVCSAFLAQLGKLP